MWTCPKCGENYENGVNSCGKCKARAVGDSQPPGRRHRWRVAFGLGILIELGIAALLVLLPRGSWLFSRVPSFLKYSHFPFLRFLNAAGPEFTVGGIVALVVAGFSMALVWGCLKRGQKRQPRHCSRPEPRAWQAASMRIIRSFS